MAPQPTTAHHYLLRYAIPGAGNLVLALATDIFLPSSTKLPVAKLPAEIKAGLPATISPNAIVGFGINGIPAQLGNLVAHLIGTKDLTLAEVTAAITAHNPAAAQPGKDYANDGRYTLACDKLLRWLLAEGTMGLEASPCPIAAEIAGLTRSFLASESALTLEGRAHFLHHVSELGGRFGGGEDARNAVRAVMALVSEYQDWSQANPAEPEPEALVNRRGRGILRKLAERTLKALPESADRKTYRKALADRILQAIASPQPLPAVYPATRQRLTPTAKHIAAALNA